MNTVSDEIAQYLTRLLPREARWAYWQHKNGPIFFYNTEPIHEMYPGPAEGKFESGVCRPVGPGSRSGKAKEWQKDEEMSFIHVLRRDAKDRAHRMFLEWLEGEA